MKSKFLLIARHPVYSYYCIRNKLPLTDESILTFKNLQEDLRNLKNKNEHIRKMGSTNLMRATSLSVYPSKYLSTLGKALKDKNDDIRWNVSWLLAEEAKKGLNISRIMNLVIAILDDTVPTIRSNATDILANAAKHGTNISKALPKLTKMLQDEDSVVRVHASLAFAEAIKATSNEIEAIHVLNSNLSYLSLTTVVNILLILLSADKRGLREEAVKQFVGFLENIISLDQISTFTKSISDKSLLDPYIQYFIRLLESDWNRGKATILLCESNLTFEHSKQIINLTRRNSKMAKQLAPLTTKCFGILNDVTSTVA